MITQRYGDPEVAYTTQWNVNRYFHTDVGGLLVKDLSSGQDLLQRPWTSSR